ncbi:MAG: methionine--tRNA ligase, partial [Candidatus Thermoplasmatota archaeon]|nr:methionine--tRNA ligase [Candidatus Thermoplasmatota archaeon]
MERIFIGVAWPYANGPLHLGHVAGSLLPPDIFARFHRMQGNEVLMVSGSDEHGTPITVTAEKEGISPEEVIDRWHKRHVDTIEEMGIQFDLFTRTSTEHHREWVHKVFRGLQEEGYIEERVMTQPYDPKAERFLPDRYVEGECPHCGYEDARGDQCDDCGKTLDANELIEPRSKFNPEVDVEFRETKHAFFLLSKLEDRLADWFTDGTHPWRANVERFTQNWLDEGLHDRAVTRDIDWGIPWIDDDPTYQDKRIYVWFEAFCGYFTAAVKWAKDIAGDPEAWKPFWEEDHDDVPTRSYYFLAKDNIPFHTILWPGILMGYSDALETQGQPRLNLPFDVPANEYLNLSGEQFSKSRGVGIWAHEVLEHFQPDAVRYYLAVNMPETRDTDWTWDDFIAKVNDELVAAYGNFVHRTLSMAHKYVGEIPEPGELTPEDEALLEAMRATHAKVTEQLEAARFKHPLRDIMELAREGNKYVNDQAPWQLSKDDPARCATVLHTCLRLARGLALLTAPYMPHAAERLWDLIGQEGSVHAADWASIEAPLAAGTPLSAPDPLFEKLDPEEVHELVGQGE